MSYLNDPNGDSCSEEIGSLNLPGLDVNELDSRLELDSVIGSSGLECSPVICWEYYEPEDVF